MRPPPPSPSPPPPESGSLYHSSGHHPPPSPSPPPPEATELVAFDDLGGGFESLKPTDLAEDGDDADVQHAIILTIVLAVLIVIFLAWRACKRCQARKEQSLPQLDGLEELRPRRTVADRVYGAKASARRVQSGLRAKWASGPKHERVTELEEAREDSRQEESGSDDDDRSSDEESSEGESSSGSSASASSASGPSAVPASEASAVPASEASASSAPSSAIREGAAYAGAAYAESVATSYHGTEIGPDDSVSQIGRPCVLKAAKARSLNQNVIVTLRDTRTGRTATLPATPTDLDSLDALHAVFERAGLVRVGTCNFADAEQQLFELHSKADLRRARIHAVIIYATGEMVSAAPNPLMGARVTGGALDEGRAGSESAFSSSRPRGGGLVFKSKKGAAAKPSGSESDDGETLVLFETKKKEEGGAVDYF